MDVIIAARLSQKQANGEQGIGIETQDKRSTEWSEREGHNVVAVVADTQSGTVAPWDRKNLRPWVTDPALMTKYQGIVAYKNDRLSRGAWDDEIRIREWAKIHGKKLLIVDGPQWPPRDDGDFWSWTAQAKQASKEWEEIRERSMRAQKELRERGKLVGKPPWGFKSVGVKYDKIMMPTDIGREYIPQIFARCIAGESLAAIGAWLTDEGVPSPNGKAWHAIAVNRIIRNTAYIGRRQDASGKTILRCEPLLVVHNPDGSIVHNPDGWPLADVTTFNRANEALTRRPKRGPQNAPHRAMLAGCLYCLRCSGPMYRIRPGRPSQQVFYYRCIGKISDGAKRKGCGNMIRLSVLDAMVSESISGMTTHIFETKVTPGIDHSAEIEEIKLEIGDLGKQDLSDDEFDRRMTELRAERDRLKSLPEIPDRVERVDTGVSYAEMWAKLSDSERGEWLRRANVKIWALKGSLADVDALPMVSRDPETVDASSGPDLASRIPYTSLIEKNGVVFSINFGPVANLGTTAPQLQRATKAGE